MIKYFETPITVNFIITRNCNGNCAFCGVEHKSGNFLHEVDITQIKKIIDIFDENQVLRINFFGGEPTVYSKLLEAMKYAKDKKFYNTIVTNGLFLPKDIYNYRTAIDGIAVSVHGLETEHCELGQVTSAMYLQIIKNLSSYSAMGIPVTVNMTVTPMNYKTIPEFVDYMLSQADIKAFAFNRYIPSPSVLKSNKKKYVMDKQQLNESLEYINNVAIKHPKLLYKYAIHFPYCIVENKEYLKYVGNCGFGQNYISVDCDGNMQTCSYSDHILGNIFQNDMKNIWCENEVLKQYRKLEWLPEKCKRCEFRPSCMAGCKMTGEGEFSPDILIEDDNG